MADRGLGRGLDALFGSGTEEKKREKVQTTTVGMIELIKIEPNLNQPRKTFDKEALANLVESIRENGIITPLTVRKIPDGRFQIVAGERRWKAARELGLKEVPAYVIESDDRQTMLMALVENLQREDLNAVEEAEGYQRLIREFGMTQEKVAEKVGKSRPAIANTLRILSLPDTIRKRIVDGRLSEGHARTLLPLEDEKAMLRAADVFEEKEFSVRQAENYVKKLLRTADKDPKKAVPGVDYVGELEKELSQRLGHKVRILEGKNKGHIEIEYYGNEDLEELCRRLQKI